MDRFAGMEQSRRTSSGFTLVEVCMVMVVFALCGGAVLAANELMANARTRMLIGQMESHRGAYLGFVDRYRSAPGDYASASATIRGVTASGNGNGLIEGTVSPVLTDEPIAAWEHLARAGFLEGGFTYAPGSESPASAPRSPFDAYPRLESSNRFAGSSGPRHLLASGNQVPADVLAEADRKVDDGLAWTGSFRFSGLSTAGPAPTPSSCYDDISGAWRVTGAIERNCGGAWLMN